jgi:hypothetical protein
MQARVLSLLQEQRHLLQQQEQQLDAAPTVVHNAFCDGAACKQGGTSKRIVGARFKCAACPDFDFCESCFVAKADTHPANHMFVKLSGQHGNPFAGNGGRPCGGGRFGGRHPCWRQHPMFCGKPVVPQPPTAAPAAPQPAAPVAAPVPVAAPAEPQQQYELEHLEKGEITLMPGARFVKIVKFKNLSSSPIQGAALFRSSGDSLGAARVPIGTIGSGEERYVAIDIEAPRDASGSRNLVSVYRLAGEQVVQGEPVVISVRVL